MTIVPSSFRSSHHSGGVLAADSATSKSSMLRAQGSSSSGRLPLRPRNANVENRIRGTPAVTPSSSSSSGLLSKQHSSASLRSNGAASTGSKYSYLIDSSGNECNRRVSGTSNSSGTSLSSAALASSTLRKLNAVPDSNGNGGNGGAAGGGIGDHCSDTSTVAETGQKIAANILGAKPGGTTTKTNASVRSASPAPSAAMSSASASTCDGQQSGRSRSQSKPRSVSAQRPSAVVAGGGVVPPPPVSARSSSDPSRASGSADGEVIIEERRRSSSGDGYTIHKYVRGRLLGKGGFAKVYWCTSMDTGRHYAVKIVPKANLVKSRARQKLQAEIKIHRTLRHKHICEFKHFFEDKMNCYILLELCANQSMNELIKRRKRLTETEVQYYMMHLIDAVKYMHDKNVIHRDLKLGNLFLDKHLQVKVGDLGLATKVTSSEEKRKTICGTPNYIAPEVIDGNKETRGHSFEVDIWSMGVILFTTLVGKPPYESKDVKSTYQRILANQYSFPSHVPISQHAKDLIVAMLQTKPEKRPTLKQIRSHPFLTRVEGKIPKSLPSSCVHVAPDWQEDAFGNLAVVERGNGRENFSRPTASSSSRHKKQHREEGKASAASRPQPLSMRDPNVAANRKGDASEKQNRVDGAGGTARESSRGSEGERELESRQVQRGAPSSSQTKSTQKFRIYDDNGGTVEVVQETEADIGPPPSKNRHEKPPQCSPDDELDELASKVSSCTLREKGSAKPESNTLSLGADAAKAKELPPTAAAEKDRDMVVLESMYTRLTDMFKRVENKAAGLDEVSLFDRTSAAGVSTAFGVNSDWGATKWVTRYVDYTSKYGLGFLLNNGSAGVYFNDSTKAVLAPKGENFMYIERKKTSSDGRLENMCEIHTLSSYPESLQKKVTLLKHFRNYLVEQQKRAVEEGEEEQDIFGSSLDLEAGEESDDTALVYLKKWVRTKHAILFRLSNSTVQVVFYDHTEILLSSEARVVTYVDKKHRRITYHLDEIMNTPNAEISKRLKYTKDILQQLIPGKQ